MTIMRSTKNCGFLEGMKKKVKRKYMDWFKILNDLNSKEMFDYFFVLFSTLRKGNSMSKRRCAYYTLKHFYSTTTIEELIHKVSV